METAGAPPPKPPKPSSDTPQSEDEEEDSDTKPQPPLGVGGPEDTAGIFAIEPDADLPADEDNSDPVSESERSPRQPKPGPDEPGGLGGPSPKRSPRRPKPGPDEPGGLGGPVVSAGGPATGPDEPQGRGGPRGVPPPSGAIEVEPELGTPTTKVAAIGQVTSYEDVASALANGVVSRTLVKAGYDPKEVSNLDRWLKNLSEEDRILVKDSGVGGLKAFHKASTEAFLATHVALPNGSFMTTGEFAALPEKAQQAVRSQGAGALQMDSLSPEKRFARMQELGFVPKGARFRGVNSKGELLYKYTLEELGTAITTGLASTPGGAMAAPLAIAMSQEPGETAKGVGNMALAAIPVFGTVYFWGAMSPTFRGVSIAADALVLASPFVSMSRVVSTVRYGSKPIGAGRAHQVIDATQLNAQVDRALDFVDAANPRMASLAKETRGLQGGFVDAYAAMRDAELRSTILRGEPLKAFNEAGTLSIARRRAADAEAALRRKFGEYEVASKEALPFGESGTDPFVGAADNLVTDTKRIVDLMIGQPAEVKAAHAAYSRTAAALAELTETAKGPSAIHFRIHENIATHVRTLSSDVQTIVEMNTAVEKTLADRLRSARAQVAQVELRSGEYNPEQLRALLREVSDLRATIWAREYGNAQMLSKAARISGDAIARFPANRAAWTTEMRVAAEEHARVRATANMYIQRLETLAEPQSGPFGQLGGSGGVVAPPKAPPSAPPALTLPTSSTLPRRFSYPSLALHSVVDFPGAVSRGDFTFPQGRASLVSPIQRDSTIQEGPGSSLGTGAFQQTATSTGRGDPVDVFGPPAAGAAAPTIAPERSAPPTRIPDPDVTPGQPGGVPSRRPRTPPLPITPLEDQPARGPTRQPGLDPPRSVPTGPVVGTPPLELPVPPVGVPVLPSGEPIIEGPGPGQEKDIPSRIFVPAPGETLIGEQVQDPDPTPDPMPEPTPDPTPDPTPGPPPGFPVGQPLVETPTSPPSQPSVRPVPRRAPNQIRDRTARRLEAPTGLHPRVVGWRQGRVFIYEDLVTGVKSVSSRPRFGKVPDTPGLSPRESFRIVSRSELKPTKRRVDLGVVVATVTIDGVVFTGNPVRQARVRDRTFRGRKGI